MQNKLIINAVKCLFYFGSILTFLIFSITFNGCSGSDVDEDVVTQRDLDSIEVYSKLQKAFAQYKSALSYNEASEDIKANQSFESSLRSLNEINSSIILRGENYFWKKDFDELSVSIVEDYFTTQTEIPANSLLFEFAKRNSVEYEKVEEVSPDREPLPDGSDVPLVRNSVVDGYIEFFSNTERGRSFIDKSLYRSGKYFPLMRKILKYNNMPEELIYLSVQESGLNPTITSRAGAVGLWQFMPATGNAYGLGSDSYRDDRRDFEKATDAASALLRDLYKTYDDWYLAFSAYNAGPGRVNKAIRNSGSRDFWSLRGYLPGETKNYTPSILALSFVLRNPEEYGFKDIEYGHQLTFDRVEIQSELTMQRVAELCETDVETIRDLNTELTTDIIPDYSVPYLLRIPHNSYDKFLANYNKATDIDKSSGFSPSFAGNESGDFGSEVTGTYYKVKNYSPENVRLIGSTSGLKKVERQYDKNKPLPVMAAFFNVRATDIRIWNNLNYGYLPKKNSNIAVYISEEKYKLLIGKKDGSENTNDQIVLNDEVAKTTNETQVQKVDKKTDNKNDQNVVDNKDNNSDKNVSSNTTSKTNSESNTGQVENSNVETDNSQSYSYNDNNSNPGNGSEKVYEEYTGENNDENVNSEQNNNTSAVEPLSESEVSTDTQVENSYEATEDSEEATVEDPVNDETSYESTETYNEYAESFNSGNETVKENNSKSKSKSAYYTVEAGDNLTKIASENNVSLSDLIEWNKIEDDKILVGQKLIVSKSAVNTSGKNSKTVKKTYKVKKGDTLSSIAERNNVSMKDIKAWNGLKSDKVMLGQVLKLYK